MQKRINYNEVNPLIAINILNFNLFSETDGFHTSYHLYEDKEKFRLTDVMEFHFIEMSKLIQDWKGNQLDPWNDVLARWLLDRKSTRLNSSHVAISYAVFCLK